MNIGFFTGYIAATPALIEKDGQQFTNITLIQSHKNADQQEVATSLNFVAFAKMAAFITKNCRKGDKLLAQYYMRNRQYTDKDGNKIYTNSFILSAVEFAGPGKETREYLHGLEMDALADKDNPMHRSYIDLV